MPKAMELFLEASGPVDQQWMSCIKRNSIELLPGVIDVVPAEEPCVTLQLSRVQIHAVS
jgi:hypothetical protein